MQELAAKATEGILGRAVAALRRHGAEPHEVLGRAHALVEAKMLSQASARRVIAAAQRAGAGGGGPQIGPPASCTWTRSAHGR